MRIIITIEGGFYDMPILRDKNNTIIDIVNIAVINSTSRNLSIIRIQIEPACPR